MDKNLNEVIDDSIAIIGMAGRFPGANNIKQFWENLCLGKESISFFTEEELLAAGISPNELNDPAYVKAKGLIDDIDKFDAKFFGILPTEAEILDPQHRILLECVWTALEDAGYHSEENAGRIAVFAGCGFNTYYPKIICRNKKYAEHIGDFNAAIGNGNDYLSTRISYKFNFTGPSINVQTACSTSLVAVSLACNSLLDYQCDMAIAGGTSAFFPIKSGYHYRKELIFSADGHCRPLDAQGTGTLFGMGVGVVILKRLQDAIHDRDHIYAVIRGWAVNNDGGTRVGYTAPAQYGQMQAIEEALTVAQVDPSSIQFIEAHATATPIGDPIEVQALTEVFQAATDKKHFCALGTVKANVGHLDAAAGVTGLIKTALVLKQHKIPPAVNFTEPNPKINFADSPFYVPHTLQDWTSEGKVRRAGVSSFGVGGTNVHVVLEEAPELIIETKPHQKPYYLFTFSAKTDNALRQRLLDFEAWLTSSNDDFNIEAISYTLNVGRKAFEKRCAIVASSTQELHEIIQAVNQGHLHHYFLAPTKIDTNFPETTNHILEDLETTQAVNVEGYGEKLLQLGRIFISGAVIDWERLHHHEAKNRLPMPTYPFERVRYWPPVETSRESVVNQWYYFHPVWQHQEFDEAEKKILQQFLMDRKNSKALLLAKNSNKNCVSHLEPFFHSVKHIDLENKKFPDDPLPDFIIYQADSKILQPEIALKETFYAVILLVQTLLRFKLKNLITIVYCYQTEPGAYIEPFAAALVSLWKTITLEQPLIRGLLLHTDSNLAFDTPEFANKIMETLAGNELEVDYRLNRRFIKRLEPLTTINSDKKIFRTHGVYLITGGTHGLGWKIATHLALTYQARIILMSRTAPDENQLAELIASGHDILYVRGDVAKKKDVQNVINEAQNKFGAINGVIHCAGVIKDALLKNKKTEEMTEVLAAKIVGTLFLDDYLVNESLDCFILFSSVAALFGNIGQSDYAYANGFLDAFAHARNALYLQGKKHGKTLSINWSPWAEGGMKISLSLRDWMKKNFGFTPLTTQEGLQIFELVSSLDTSQVVILSGDKQKIDALLKDTYEHAVINNSKQEVDQAEIYQTLLNILTDITHLPPTELDKNASLFDLGLDSIILAQLIARIEKEFAISLEDNVQDILFHPTIVNIANFIIQLIKKAPTQTTQQNSDDNPFSDQIVILKE